MRKWDNSSPHVVFGDKLGLSWVGPHTWRRYSIYQENGRFWVTPSIIVIQVILRILRDLKRVYKGCCWLINENSSQTSFSLYIRSTFRSACWLSEIFSFAVVAGKKQDLKIKWIVNNKNCRNVGKNAYAFRNRRRNLTTTIRHCIFIGIAYWRQKRPEKLFQTSQSCINAICNRWKKWYNCIIRSSKLNETGHSRT